MMSKDKLILDASVNAAIKNFHSSKDGEGWIVFGYSGETTIVVIAEGSGGLPEASKHFIDSDARFALLRKEHKVEISRTTKFAFIDYTPSTIIPKRKALLSTHKGQIKDLLKPYHVAAEWSSSSEIDENEILSKIGMASGTQNNVTTKEVYSHKATGLNAAANATTAAVASGSFVPNSVTKERELKLIDESGIKAAIADVRSDSTATDWCFIGYSGTDFTSLHLKGKGEGGIPALLSAIESDDAVSYSFFRTTEKIDKTVAVKFGFIKIIPANAIPSVKRGLISTHQGFIQKIFEPFHVSFDVQTVKDISPEIITDKITSYSGTKSHVVNDESKKPTPAHILHGTKPDVAPPKALVPVNHGSITIADEHVWKEAIKAVRDAKNENINYLIATYSAKNTIALLKTGYGTVDDLKQSFESENANWGIIRITDIIDNKSITTKFAYIRWLPSSVPATKRGAIGALKGAIDSLFSPYHVDAFAERLDDVNHQLIVDKVGSASGSKSHVK